MGEGIYAGMGVTDMPISIQKNKSRVRRAIPKAGGFVSNIDRYNNEKSIDTD